MLSVRYRQQSDSPFLIQSQFDNRRWVSEVIWFYLLMPFLIGLAYAPSFKKPTDTNTFHRKKAQERQRSHRP
jgi:hypothetical protein